MAEKDIETIFIGTLLMNPSVINYARYLKPEYLYGDRNAAIYTWLLDRANSQPGRSKPYDPALVAVQTNISINYIITAIGMVENVEYALQYARILYDRYVNDEIIETDH